MRQRFINNFSTLVAATFGAGDTQLRLASTAGLPILGVGEYFLLTVYRQVGIEESGHEVIKVTDVVGDMLTIATRALEGAAASQFLTGDRVQARLTMGSLQAKADQIDMTAAQADIVAHTASLATKATQAGLDAANVTLATRAAQADLQTLSDTVATKASTTAMTAAIAQAKADIVNSSPAALDTLNELALALGNDANFAATTATALGNRVRVDTAAQGLTGTQKTNAKTNLALENLDNTSDANKPVSTAQATAIALKANQATTYTKTEVDTADALALPKAGGTMTGDITGADRKIIQMQLQDIGMVAIDKGNSGTALVTFDYTAGCFQKITATGNHTFAFSNWPPTGNVGYMQVEFANYGAFTVTPPTVTWTNPNGSETTDLVAHFAALAAAGGRSGFTAAGLTKAIFWCKDAGGTVYGKFI